jgi:hypothetical protein
MPAPKLTKSARVLLEKTFKRMRQMPDTFDMDEWMIHDSKVEPSGKRLEPYCGTVACFAGHVALAATGCLPEEEGSFYQVDRLPKRIREKSGGESIVSTANLALAYLGIRDMMGNYRPLFLVVDWPEPFKHQYEITTTEREKVRVTIKRVRHWLRTGK